MEKQVPEKATEPMPSTSKALSSPASTTAARGRKRTVKSSEVEIPEKIVKTVEMVESLTVKSPATKTKFVAKGKPTKKTSEFENFFY